MQKSSSKTCTNLDFLLQPKIGENDTFSVVIYVIFMLTF